MAESNLTAREVAEGIGCAVLVFAFFALAIWS